MNPYGYGYPPPPGYPYGYPPPNPYQQAAAAGAAHFGAAHFGAAHFGAYGDPMMDHMMAMAGAAPAMVRAPQMPMQHHYPQVHHAMQAQGQFGAPGPDAYIAPQLPGHGPERFEHTPLGIPVTVIPAGGTVPVVTRPQVTAYRPRGLVIPSSIGTNFRVLSIVVGTDLVFAGSEGGVPALVFSELAAQKVGFVTRSAPTALDITIQVQNTDTLNPQTFEGTYFGDAFR